MTGLGEFELSDSGQEGERLAQSAALTFLEGGGEMGALIRAKNWSATPLGVPETWPQSLRLVVRVMLSARHPMYLFWGREAICLYNDAYRASLGPERHPGSLGRPALEVWSDLWDVVGPQIAQVQSGGGPTWHENQCLSIVRHGVREEVYWTYGYSPVEDDQAPLGIGGVLALGHETTAEVLGRRRLAEKTARERRLFQQMPGFVCVLRGADHVYEFVNDTYVATLGPREFLGRAIRECLPDLSNSCVAILDQVFATGTSFSAKALPIRLPGTEQDRFFDVLYEALRDEHGAISGVFGCGYEVTERIHAESVRRTAERRQSLLFEVMWAQRRASDADAVVQIAADAIERFRQGGSETSQGSEEDLRLVREIGELTRDAVEHRRADAALRASEARFRLMADGVDAPIWVTDQNGELEFVNRAFDEFFGTPLAELRQGGWQRLIHPDEATVQVRDSHTALAQRERFRGHSRMRHASGEWRWIDSSGIPRIGESGEFLGHVTVAIDVTTMVTSQASLRDADRRKDEFLATLSHELRSPLAPIRTAARILATPNLSADQLQWAQSVIQRQVKHMAWLLDDLLDLARITQRKLELKKDRVELKSVVDAAVEATRPILESKQHSLQVNLPSQPVVLEADPLRLSQILSNLLSNAAKYTDPGGNIRLVADLEPASDERGAWLKLTVRDNGIGIPSEAIGRIFEMFSQVEGALTRSEGGLGIGLSLVSGLVSLHGGTVAARSDGPGRGSEFIVHLPLGPDAPQFGSGAEGNAPRVAACRVLVADDNRDAADSLALLLELAGHELRVAYGGVAVLSLAAEFRPEVVLLDIGMPDMNGYEVVRALRREPWGTDIRVIALTGWGQDADLARAVEAGFDEHLTKPVDPETLDTLIHAGRSTQAAITRRDRSVKRRGST